MANMTIPTSRDIYLELNGKKLAVVQGYSAKALRTSREVEAFGESEPVATVGGQTRYTLELSRLYATDEAIVFESACGRQARSGQDCDGWEENG